MEMNSFASHTYMKYVYCPEDDMDDDVTKIMHTIKCQVTQEVVWYDTHHSPYKHMSREQFVEFIDDKLAGRKNQTLMSEAVDSVLDSLKPFSVGN
jgi:hypothetical protein